MEANWWNKTPVPFQKRKLQGRVLRPKGKFNRRKRAIKSFYLLHCCKQQHHCCREHKLFKRFSFFTATGHLAIWATCCSSREVEFIQKEDAERRRLEEAEKAHLAEIQGLQVRVTRLSSSVRFSSQSARLGLAQRQTLLLNFNTTNRAAWPFVCMNNWKVMSHSRFSSPLWRRWKDGVQLMEGSVV